MSSAAGDLIGASPLASGLMHDEPTIDVMNYVGLDTIGVGNHEFDEGKAELLRMQYGNRHGGGGADGGTAYVPARADGCHPVDGCQDGTPFYGSVFQYLAANVTDTRHRQPAACRPTGSSTPRRARRSPSSARRSRARR